jgi:Raf kinase inhibitor-like YbhB/YbcL family protein
VIAHLGRIALAAGMVVGACQLAAAADPFMLTSTAFKYGTMMPQKHAGAIKSNPNCLGQNVSPAFAWHNVPAGTKSFALIMVDPEGRGGLGVMHWVAYGIPGSLTGFAEGETEKASDKFVGGKGTAGLNVYIGPCTPPGTDYHHYTFTLIATDLDPKALPAGLTRDELFAKLDGHVKASAGLVARFKYPK